MAEVTREDLEAWVDSVATRDNPVTQVHCLIAAETIQHKYGNAVVHGSDEVYLVLSDGTRVTK